MDWSSKKNVSIFAAVLLVVAIVIFVQVYDIAPDVSRNVNKTSFLPEKDTYYISSKEPGPQIYEASFDPLGSVAPGVKQVFRVKVRYEKPVDSVSVTMIIDNGEYAVPLALNEGSAEDGVWGGSWSVKDTHNVIYQAKIEAKSGEASSTVVLSFQ